MQEQMIDRNVINQIFDQAISENKKAYDKTDLSKDFKDGYIVGLKESRNMLLMAYDSIEAEI